MAIGNKKESTDPRLVDQIADLKGHKDTHFKALLHTRWAHQGTLAKKPCVSTQWVSHASLAKEGPRRRVSGCDTVKPIWASFPQIKWLGWHCRFVLGMCHQCGQKEDGKFGQLVQFQTARKANPTKPIQGGWVRGLWVSEHAPISTHHVTLPTHHQPVLVHQYPSSPTHTILTHYHPQVR